MKRSRVLWLALLVFIVCDCKKRPTAKLAGANVSQEVEDEMNFLAVEFTRQNAETDGIHASDDEAYTFLRDLFGKYKNRTDMSGLAVKYNILNFFVEEISLKRSPLFSGNLEGGSYAEDLSQVISYYALEGPVSEDDNQLLGDGLNLGGSTKKTCTNFEQCQMLIAILSALLDATEFQKVLYTAGGGEQVAKILEEMNATFDGITQDIQEIALSPLAKVLQFRMESIRARVSLYQAVNISGGGAPFVNDQTRQDLKQQFGKLIRFAEREILDLNNPGRVGSHIKNLLSTRSLFFLSQEDPVKLASFDQAVVAKEDPNSDESILDLPDDKKAEPKLETFQVGTSAKVAATLEQKIDGTLNELAGVHVTNRAYYHYLDRLASPKRDPRAWYNQMTQLPEVYKEQSLKNSPDKMPETVEKLNNYLAFSVLFKFMALETELPFRDEYLYALRRVSDAGDFDPEMRKIATAALQAVSITNDKIRETHKAYAKAYGPVVSKLVNSERELYLAFSDFTGLNQEIPEGIEKANLEALQAFYQYDGFAKNPNAAGSGNADTRVDNIVKAEQNLQKAINNKLRQELNLVCRGYGVGQYPDGIYRTDAQVKDSSLSLEVCRAYYSKYDRASQLTGPIDLKELCAFEPGQKNLTLDIAKAHVQLVFQNQEKLKECGKAVKENIGATANLLMMTMLMPGIGLAQNFVSLGSKYFFKRALTQQGKDTLVKEAVVAGASGAKAIEGAAAVEAVAALTAKMTTGQIFRSNAVWLGKKLIFPFDKAARWYGKHLVASATFEVLMRSFQSVVFGQPFVDPKKGWYKDFAFSVGWGGLVFGALPVVHHVSNWTLMKYATSTNTKGVGAWIHAHRGGVKTVQDFVGLTAFFTGDGYVRGEVEKSVLGIKPPPGQEEETFLAKLTHSAVITMGFQVLTPFYASRFRGIAERKLADPGLTKEGKELWQSIKMSSEKLDHKLFVEALGKQREYKILHKRIEEILLTPSTKVKVPIHKLAETLKKTKLDVVHFIGMDPLLFFGIHSRLTPPEEIPALLKKNYTYLMKKLERIIKNDPGGSAGQNAESLKGIAEKLYDRMSTEKGLERELASSMLFQSLSERDRQTLLYRIYDERAGGEERPQNNGPADPNLPVLPGGQ